MITVDNKVLNINVLTVIERLREDLLLKGIERFSKIKVNNDNLQVTCPIHKNGQEQKPSAGIVLKGNEKVEEGTIHCFTCGYTATLPELISDCFGFEDKGKFGKSWLLQNFASADLRQRTSLNLAKPKIDKPITYICENELDTYRYYHPYMFKRKLTKEIINLFDVGFDKKTNCLTFPTNDEQGNCLFITRRSVVGKYFNYPNNVDKPVYGLDKIPFDVTQVVVCESIINALTCWVYGDYAIALLGTGTQHQYDILKKSHIRKFILAFDGDNAGDKASERFKKALQNKAIITKLEIPRGKDINDLSKEEYLNLNEKYY